MHSIWRTIEAGAAASVLLACIALVSAQKPPGPPSQSPPSPSTPKQSRDLLYENDDLEPAKPKVSIPRSYALVIGIAKYQNLAKQDQLDYSERDAQSIYSVLISAEGGNFKAANVHTLIGTKATLAAMKAELETWLPSVSKEDDRVLIYFAGHGFVSKGRAYLAPYDIDPKTIAATGYPMDDLGKVIGSSIKAKWKVLLTDACHSGAITPEQDRQAINGTLQSLNQSLFSLTASRDREQSFESKEWDGGHGIFSYYVKKGLEGEADESADGVVSADELAEYVRRNVREATGGRQNPTSDRGSFDPKMILGYIPSGGKPGVRPPPKDGTLVFEANTDGVEVFLDGVSAGVLNKGASLRLPGLRPGPHTIKGVKMGYEPDGPREEVVYPGQEQTVSLKIVIASRRKKAAVEDFDKGMEEYNKGSSEHYKKAVVYFDKALKEQPDYSQAALYLGRTYNLLFDNDQARTYYKRAIEIDPDYLEARATYGGMLLDVGDDDEAIRQLTVVVQRDPANSLAQCLIAQAYRRQMMLPQAIEAAQNSIRLNPKNGEAQLWLAESLRSSGKWQDSVSAYRSYLRLSDFDSKLSGKLNYYVLGYLLGVGHKKRANLKDVWAELRSTAYFGLCDSEHRLGEFDQAIADCQEALVYDKNDPYVHYALGLAFARKAQLTGNIETLPAARVHFEETVSLNPEMEESAIARKNIQAIDQFLSRQGH